MFEDRLRCIVVAGLNANSLFSLEFGITFYDELNITLLLWIFEFTSRIGTDASHIFLLFKVAGTLNNQLENTCRNTLSSAACLNSRNIDFVDNSCCKTFSESGRLSYRNAVIGTWEGRSKPRPH